jgi:hypothetical protein
MPDIVGVTGEQEIIGHIEIRIATKKGRLFARAPCLAEKKMCRSERLLTIEPNG